MVLDRINKWESDDFLADLSFCKKVRLSFSSLNRKSRLFHGHFVKWYYLVKWHHQREGASIYRTGFERSCGWHIEESNLLHESKSSRCCGVKPPLHIQVEAPSFLALSLVTLAVQGRASRESRRGLHQAASQQPQPLVLAGWYDGETAAGPLPCRPAWVQYGTVMCVYLQLRMICFSGACSCCATVASFLRSFWISLSAAPSDMLRGAHVVGSPRHSSQSWTRVD